ncbi:MAG: T9SS type A sorting domain-containing protein [Bacteroidales bacterium]|nr:T9SS type A sorting domain-containing protein [Bacteroidales bacterium]MCF8387850.1 T9SS type A sorting domain-containing protein [Bacteroidales bacterium]MCF8397344.1 T9SS type A sorting domain-containing protein [Bacteroidales bacterium]
MKKYLLLILVISAGSDVIAQELRLEPKPQAIPKQEQVYNLVEKESSLTKAKVNKPVQKYYLNGRELEFINIGSSYNAYGFSGGSKNYVWADNHINSVVFTHRMIAGPGPSSPGDRVAYDVSWEGGEAGTWHSDNQVYEPFMGNDPARYPQGGIINPPGNELPEDAIYTYFCPVLNISNGNWGGYAYGINFLTEIDPTNPTRNVDSGTPPYRFIPDAFIVTQEGTTWMAEPSYDEENQQYTGEYIFYMGYMNDANDDIVYEWWTLDILEVGELHINDSKIAFDPTSQFGYLCVMSDSPSDPVPYTDYHPLLYATDDGGESWQEDPIHCQLGGPDGIDSVKYYLPDATLDAIFGEGQWDRETIFYNMGYHTGFHVDFMGNAHCLGIITPSSEDGWYPNPDVMGTFHLWYDRQTKTWDAKLLYMNRTFEGDMGGISMYNRPYISSDMIGQHLLFSWLDTDQEGVEENVSPDIYLLAYDLINHDHYEVENVTSHTQAMWSAYWGSMSHYVFSELLGNDLICKVPFVYEEADPNDPGAEVTFWYINGFEVIFPGPWGIEEKTSENSIIVGQNHPNPFNGKTTIDIHLEKTANIYLEVYNMTGQKIMEIDKGQLNAGLHHFAINAEDLGKGVYFYTVKTENASRSRKMIIE